MKHIPQTWQWNIPEYFNIGQACTAFHIGTENENKKAMIVEDDTLGNSDIIYKELNIQ